MYLRRCRSSEGYAGIDTGLDADVPQQLFGHALVDRLQLFVCQIFKVTALLLSCFYHMSYDSMCFPERNALLCKMLCNIRRI